MKDKPQDILKLVVDTSHSEVEDTNLYRDLDGVTKTDKIVRDTAGKRVRAGIAVACASFFLGVLLTWAVLTETSKPPRVSWEWSRCELITAVESVPVYRCKGYPYR